MSQGDRQLPPLFHQHSWYSRPADFSPFFPLCLPHVSSGQRYGWVPKTIKPELRARYPFLPDTTRQPNDKSVTEFEIMHGALNSTLSLSIYRACVVCVSLCMCVRVLCVFVCKLIFFVFFFLLTICRRRVRSFARLLLFQSGERNHRYGLGRQPGEALCPQGQDFEICQDLDGLLNWRRSE